MISAEQLQEIKARCDAATPEPWALGEFMIHRGEELICHIDNYKKSDMVFTCHARTDIPSLIAEVERLQGELTKADAQIDELEMEKQDAESWTQDIFTALKKDLPPCDDDPVDEGVYAKQVVDYIRGVVAENERLQELAEALKKENGALLQVSTVRGAILSKLGVHTPKEEQNAMSSLDVARTRVAELEAKGGEQ